MQERLDREFDMNVITTVPNVSYNNYDKQGNMTEVHNPGSMPEGEISRKFRSAFWSLPILVVTSYMSHITRIFKRKKKRKAAK